MTDDDEHTEYWAWLDSGDLKPLGKCKDFEQADDRASKIGGCIWIFSREGLEEMRSEIERELK